MKTIKTCTLLCSAMMFSACVSQPNVAKLSEEQSFKYENAFQEEYKANVLPMIVKRNANKESKWLQPLNKKEACKIYFGYYKGNDYTTNIKQLTGADFYSKQHYDK